MEFSWDSSPLLLSKNFFCRKKEQEQTNEEKNALPKKSKRGKMFKRKYLAEIHQNEKHRKISSTPEDELDGKKIEKHMAIQQFFSPFFKEGKEHGQESLLNWNAMV